jgi:hypothetical protein
VTFDPRVICRVLNEEAVPYILVGGFAAALRGSPLPTTDVDIVPSRTDDALDSLARALERLGARLRTADGPIETRIDAGFLRAMPLMLNLTTDYGDIDLTFAPAGPRVDFDAWNAEADDIEIGPSLRVRVASLDAVIDSKRAAGRPKDLAALPYLESLRDELRGSGARDG